MPASGEKKNPTEDVAELEGLLEREPASARFWELADAYTRTGRYLDATAVCKRGLTQHPRSARGFVAFGRALFGIGRLGASGQALQRAIDLDPDAPEGYRLLGELLMRRAIYTEAVALLEGALDRGVDDRKLRRLLARAMDSLDSQATTVAQVPDSARGIGNIAVAGTIGGGRFVDDDDEDEEEDDDDDLLLRRHDEAEAQQQDLALRAFQTGGAEEREKGVGDANWESLENAWAEHLDAQRETRLSTDPDVPVSSKMPAIALTPLSDPLAEGMPPLPEGTAEIELPTHRRGRDGVSRGPETGPLASRPSASRVVARAGPATGVGEVPLMAAEGLVGDGDEPAPMVDSDALAASGSSGDDVDRDIEIDLDDAKAPAPLSDRRRQVDDNPPTGGASFSSRGAVPDASPRASSQVLSDDDLLSDLRAGGGGSEKDLPTEFVLPPSHRRGRGGRWLLTLIMIAGIGGGGYWGWRYLEARQDAVHAVEFARKARSAGTADALAQGISKIDRALAVRGVDVARLRSERDLLLALAWLWQREGKPPAVGHASLKTVWASRAASAAIALSRGEGPEADRLLAKRPEASQDRAIHAVLRASAAWAQGHVDVARRELDSALLLARKLSAALVLRGHIDSAQGYFGRAEESYRRALEAHPGHRLAALGLAALVLRRDPKSPELRTLLEAGKERPLPSAWRKVLLSRQRWVAGEASARREMSMAVAAAPAQRDLLIVATRALIDSCALGAADGTIRRLREQGAPGAAFDPVLKLLRGELALARGLDGVALKDLSPSGSPYERRKRVWALLLRGRLERARSLLGHERSAAAEPLRVFADGLHLIARAQADPQSREKLEEALKKRVLEPLKVLAGKRPRAWFFRAVIFERLGHPERVVAAVAHLPLGGSDRIRGELLVARAAVKRADFGAALAVAKRFSRTCPEFWPTEILRGKALLALERRAEARRVFERVRCAGRETPSLLISLARASLDLREGRKRGVTRAVALIAVARKLFGPAAKGDFARVAAVAQAEVALLQGHARDAVALLKKRPRTVTTLLLRARAYGRMGDIGSARRALKEVLKSEPKNVWARLLLGDLVLRGGSRGRRRARGLHEAAARLFEEARRLAGAEGLLASHALAWAQLGVARIALSEHHPGAAAKAARRSIDVEPDWWAPYRWLGEALLVQKKWKQAQKALQRATELTSTDATSFLLLGRSLRHGSASKTAYRAFLRLEPRSRRAKKVRRLLRRLH